MSIFSWLFKKREDLEEVKEPILPILRFDAKIFTLIYADIRTINEKFPARKGYITKGACLKQSKEIWTNYKLVDSEPVPDFYNLGHEFVHFLNGDTGDYIDLVERGK